MENIVRSYSRWSAFLIVLLFSAAVLAPGCASFKSHKRMDLTPFAENMIEMAGDIQYGLAQEKVVYLRNYMDIPETRELEVYLGKIRAVMRGSIAYSIEIVTLSSSTLTGPEQCEALANYLDGLLRPAITAPVPPLHFSIGEFDTMLQNTREQKNLLDALSMTQPIVNEIARIISEILDDANLVVDEANNAIGTALDDNNEELITGIRTVREYQLHAIASIQYIAKHRRGVPNAFDTLLAMQPSLYEVVSNPEKPTAKDLAAAEQRLIYMMKTLQEFRAQMMPDLELYWKQQGELEDLTMMYKAALRKAQVTMIAWSRAHQRLASGVTDPAKIDVLGLAKKAAKNVGPVPF
jgi:hypothetical protein